MKLLQNLQGFLTFDKVHNPLRLPRKTTSESPKLLTLKCASRHNRVHFFDMSTSKSGPNMVFFFNIWTWKSASRHNGCALFSTSRLPRVVRHWCALCILTWKRASRHNGVQFFISHLARWLRIRRFSEPTFRPSGATTHWKNTSVSRLSYLFAHLDLLSSDCLL